MSKNPIVLKHELDERSVAYAALSDKEAYEKKKELRDKIRDIQHMSDLSKNPQKVFEARELTSVLAFFRLNKYRSKFFKLHTTGPSMRQANRHPDGRSLRRN